MLLKNLINFCPKAYNKLNIKGLAVNSKEVKKGFIFFAIRGIKSNGENYIKEAIKKGALLIICNKNCRFNSSTIPVLKTKNIRNFLSKVSSKFYRLKPKNLIAVTGTNGKTSVADFFYQILNINNIPAASIGTLGIKYKNKTIRTNLTSPDIITLHKNLEKLKKNKIENVIIEASSHGLDQNRLDNLSFKAGIFTNLSQDHLDYHKTMKKYFNAKLILFSKLLSKKKYLILDKTIKQFKVLKNISKKKNLRLLNITKTIDQTNNISEKFPALYQKKNLSMAILAAELCGFNKRKLTSTLKKIKNIDGRLELIKKYPNNIKVFIDYAHTPDALFEVLKTLRKNYSSNISLVFGCGGERDFKKRPLMSKIAKNFCKKIYVTDDNPRKENPKKIRKEIIKHLKKNTYFEIGNRSLAIKTAILNSDPNEVILVAGKGHESFQDYGKKVISISDKQIVKKIKISKKKLIKKDKNYLFNSSIINKILNNKKYYKCNGLSIDSRDVKKNNF